VEEDETLMLLEGTDATHTPFYVSAPESGKVKHILLEEGDFAEEDDDLVELAEIE
jgi:biotin carboxyl carrier protein